MTKREMILAVDDSAANLQLLKGLLSNDYDVRLAKSADMALAALTKLKPNLILLDIEMPGISGFEMMETIRGNSEYREIPVIFVTSHATMDFVLRAVECGAKDYIAKPFDVNLLRTKIRSALESLN